MGGIPERAEQTALSGSCLFDNQARSITHPDYNSPQRLLNIRQVSFAL